MTSYWLVSYEYLQETQKYKPAGFNTQTVWTEKETKRKTVAIKGAVAKWLKDQKKYPVILHTQKITAKEYKELK